MTRDGGGAWANVTPPGMPALAYVGCVEVSMHDPDTVYLAATCYKLADYTPYLFVTRDSGQSWHSIAAGFPQGEITRVVRADPAQPGLLFVGAETGVFFSLDDGASWARIPGPAAGHAGLRPQAEGRRPRRRHAWAGRSGSWTTSPRLRGLADGSRRTRLFAPRTTIRTKLHFSALRGIRSGTASGIAFGIGGSIATTEPAGTASRSANTSMSVRTRPMAPSSITGWTRARLGPWR